MVLIYRLTRYYVQSGMPLTAAIKKAALAVWRGF